MSDHQFRQWSSAIHYTALRDSFCAHAVSRENHAGLATDFRLQLRRGAAYRKPRVIHFVVFHQTGEDLCLIEHSVNMLRLRQLLRFTASWHKAQLLAFGDLLDNQRSVFTLNFTWQDGVTHFVVLQRDAEITVIQHHDTVRIHTAFQQAGSGRYAVRLAPQGNRRGQTIETDVHNRAVGEGRIKGVRVLAVQITLVARRVLAVVNKGFAHFAHL